jgi:hypothetical protein
VVCVDSIVLRKPAQGGSEGCRSRDSCQDFTSAASPDSGSSYDTSGLASPSGHWGGEQSKAYYEIKYFWDMKVNWQKIVLGAINMLRATLHLVYPFSHQSLFNKILSEQSLNPPASCTWRDNSSLLIHPQPEISISTHLLKNTISLLISLTFRARCVLTDPLRFLNHDVHRTNE